MQLQFVIIMKYCLHKKNLTASINTGDCGGSAGPEVVGREQDYLLHHGNRWVRKTAN